MNKLIKIAIIIIVPQLILSACQTNSKDQQTSSPLTGDISYHQLTIAYPYFQTTHSTPQEPAESIAKLKAISEATQLTVFFGVWCHDSVREVPALLRLLDDVNNPNISYQLISLDKTKQEPLGRAKDNNILYTPTIIVSQSGKELGRIVEKPEQDLATDLATILLVDHSSSEH